MLYVDIPTLPEFRAPSATSYGVVDEIASRALVTGARVLGVRKDDIPGAHLAASLRYPV